MKVWGGSYGPVHLDSMGLVHCNHRFWCCHGAVLKVGVRKSDVIIGLCSFLFSLSLFLHHPPPFSLSTVLEERGKEDSLIHNPTPYTVYHKCSMPWILSLFTIIYHNSRPGAWILSIQQQSPFPGLCVGRA